MAVTATVVVVLWELMVGKFEDCLELDLEEAGMDRKFQYSEGNWVDRQINEQEKGGEQKTGR